jgi:hypothetical protein
MARASGQMRPGALIFSKDRRRPDCQSQALATRRWKREPSFRRAARVRRIKIGCAVHLMGVGVERAERRGRFLSDGEYEVGSLTSFAFKAPDQRVLASVADERRILVAASYIFSAAGKIEQRRRIIEIRPQHDPPEPQPPRRARQQFGEHPANET